MGWLILLFCFMVSNVHAADCPPLLDAALPTLSDDKPASICQYREATGSRPGWNFHKYLVDRRGAKALAFDTRVSPTDPKIVNEIERLLAEKGDAK